MSDKEAKLRDMLDKTIESYGKSIVSSNKPYKIIKKNLNISKEDSAALLEEMKQKAVGIIRERIEEMMQGTEIKERFDSLAEMERTSEEVNKELNMENGYTCTDPKVDVELHVHESMEALHIPTDELINDLKDQLYQKEAELQEKTRIFEELKSIVTSQQNILKQ